MKKHIHSLLKYNHWANQKMLAVIEAEAAKDDRIVTLYSHIISAQAIWLLRIKGLPTSPFPIWEKYKVSELQTMTNETHDNWGMYLETHHKDTFEEMVFYTNSAGKKFENTVREIVSHVVNHGTYHRGQIALLLREKGINPPVTDYIAYAREN
jgi:uncharacterized damage-inducible protein DinB